MGIIDDILSALDRIPIWKRLQGVPAEVDDLKARVADLEEKLGGEWPPDVCKFCGERALRLNRISGPNTFKKMVQHWACSECNQIEKRQV